MDDNSIKEIIALLREKKGLSQTELANRIGIDRNTYRNLEKGDTRILSPHIEAIAKELGTTTEHLLLGTDLEDERKLSLNDIDARETELVSIVRNMYSEKISMLEKEVADLKELVEILKSRIYDKDLIISMLRKNS